MAYVFFLLCYYIRYDSDDAELLDDGETCTPKEVAT